MSSRFRFALAVAAVAAVLAWIFRGFTVDDALVTARVASHWAAGRGYRFNNGGPAVDAVTPLGWVQLLALPGAATPLEMFERARWLGFAAWVVAAGLLGLLVPRDAKGRVTVLVGIGVSAPLAAWASAGMETGFVTLLATLALVEGTPGFVAAGVAAALRPELLPWAFVLASGGALSALRPARERLIWLGALLTLALGPAVAVACVRRTWFGAFAPLSVVAKAPDLAHGVFYALDAVLGTGIPLLLLAPRALSRGGARTLTLAVALLAHVAALVLAGGDWMALYRLMVPVLPTALLAAARLAEHLSWRALAIRGVLFSLRPLWVLVAVAWPGRHVLAHRLDLIAKSRALLQGRRSIACLDVGWVGAATDANLLDLAGITDPMVARLPGGHTSKRIESGLLENRDVDSVVLLLAPDEGMAQRWQESRFARAVEARVAALPALDGFDAVAVLPLGGTRQRYVVAIRRDR